MEIQLGDDRLGVEAEDDLLTSLLREGRWPTGPLCLAGDCANCLAVVDGVAYVRMCMTRPRNGMQVDPFPVGQLPPLPSSPRGRIAQRRSLTVDVVVIGAGDAGREAVETTEGTRLVLLDERLGLGEALAIYAGPEVVARIDGEIVRIHASRVVVATGAADILPIVPGSELKGILTRTAAERLANAGVDLGSVVAVGAPPDGIDCRVATGELARFEGRGRVEAVVTTDGDGEHRHDCTTAVVGIGTYPRDTLARMVGGSQIETVGGAAMSPKLPRCPSEGTVCPCSGVEMTDLRSAWDRGFRELELLKRSTLAGTGTCQGGTCAPYLRSFVADQEGHLRPSFTARPLARQMTMGEAAAGVRFPPVHRTALDRIHRTLGARMDRVGGWWRPWTYGDLESEYWAVRERVSLGDVGTLGKIIVDGPDSVAFLERIYANRVTDMAPGRSRYALALTEGGGVLDDGIVARIDDTRFWLTFTSAGASRAEAWLRDWASTFEANVRIMDVTHSFGAINVTGPLATRLMERIGLDEPLRLMRHRQTTITGIPCRLLRLSFTGEISYELHHPVAGSEKLWEELTRHGRDLGVTPHGLQVLQVLRLEKGHIVVGQDTEPDSTPRRLGMEWAVAMDKPDFVGRTALERTDRLPLDKRLVGIEMDGEAPIEGSPIFLPDGEMAGYVTSAARSYVLDRTVMLGWVNVEGGTRAEVVVDGRPARLAQLPFYDPEGALAKA